MRVPLRAVNRYARPFETHLSHSTHSIKMRSMPKLPFSDTTDVEASEAPIDFPNASPFRPQKPESDQFGKAMFIGLAIVLVVFLGSMIAVLMMHAPRL
jgi:hypothetical protein